MLPLYYRKLVGNITDVKTRFNAMLDRLENNLINGTPSPANEKLYQKYFTITETPVRGKVYSFKEDAIRKSERNYGYFDLMTNGIKDSVEVLHLIPLNITSNRVRLIIYQR